MSNESLKYPHTLQIPCLLYVDLFAGESPKDVASEVIAKYQNMMEYGGWAGRGDYIIRDEKQLLDEHKP